MKYCPFCGKELTKFEQMQIPEFIVCNEMQGCFKCCLRIWESWEKINKSKSK